LASPDRGIGFDAEKGDEATPRRAYVRYGEVFYCGRHGDIAG